MTDKPLYEQLAEIGASKPEAWESLERVTISRETLEQAIRALENALPTYWTEGARIEACTALRAALAAQPADPSMDTVLRNAARRSAKIVDRGRMVKPVEPVAWMLDTTDGKRFMATDSKHDGDWLPLYAAPPAPAAVPPGWKLVPIEPTPGMIASGAVALMKASHSDIDPTMEEVTAAYRAMIAAGDKS